MNFFSFLKGIGEVISIGTKINYYHAGAMRNNAQADAAEARKQYFEAKTENIRQANLTPKKQKFVSTSKELRTAEKKYYQKKLIIERQLLALEKQKHLAQIKIENQRLQLKQAELEFQAELSGKRFQMLREFQQENVNLKWQKIQQDWDIKKNWFSQINRIESERILSQYADCLLILTSLPKIAQDPSLNLFRNLDFELEMRNLDDVLEKYYPSRNNYHPVKQYSNYFKEPIGRIEIEQLHHLLNRISTYVIYPDITAKKITFRIAFWEINGELQFFPEKIEWNWQEMQQQLIAEGKPELETILQIRNSFVPIYTVITAFLSDSYYLAIDPLYKVKFSSIKNEQGFELPRELINNFQQLEEQRQTSYLDDLEDSILPYEQILDLAHGSIELNLQANAKEKLEKSVRYWLATYNITSLKDVSNLKKMKAVIRDRDLKYLTSLIDCFSLLSEDNLPYSQTVYQTLIVLFERRLLNSPKLEIWLTIRKVFLAETQSKNPINLSDLLDEKNMTPNQKEILQNLVNALNSKSWNTVVQIQQEILSYGNEKLAQNMEYLLSEARKSSFPDSIQSNANSNSGTKTPKISPLNLSDSLPKPRLAIEIRDKSQLIQQGKDEPSIYKINLEEDFIDEEKYLAKYHLGKKIPASPEKVIMVVGATGAGKTTLINGMINYILGVEWEDDFRFQLVTNQEEGNKSQAHSQTTFISAYTINSMPDISLPYSLTIVDTPGYGDTRGIKRDELITNQIREFFSMDNGVDCIDAIGFVVQASCARLTPTQKYIFNAILSIFGKDIAKNIFLMITFCDGQKPPVLDAVKEADIPYAKFFKFNNSALFVSNKNDSNVDLDDDDDDDNFDKMFWKMGTKSFKKFFNDFEKAESISLTLTKDVLKERKSLEATVNGLLPRIKEAQLKLDELLREESILIQFKTQIEENKDFTWQDTVPKQKMVNLPIGVHVTNCLQCNRTCHDSCIIAEDQDKYLCCVMNPQDTSGVCMVCGCKWDLHVNNPYKFESYSEKVTKTYDEIKARYEEGIEAKLTVENVIQSLNQELEEKCQTIFKMIERIQKSLKRLDEIALKPNPLTQVEYIDILIDSEQQEAKPGWKERVKYYKEARDFAVTLSNMQNASDIQKKESTKEWAEKLIEKLRTEKVQELKSYLIKNPPKKKSTTETEKKKKLGVFDFFPDIFGSDN